MRARRWVGSCVRVLNEKRKGKGLGRALPGANAWKRERLASMESVRSTAQYMSSNLLWRRLAQQVCIRCVRGIYQVQGACVDGPGLCACGWSPCGAVRRMSGCAGGEGGRKGERHRVSRPHSAVACCRFYLLYCFLLSLSSFVSVCGDCTGSLYTPAIRICPLRASAIFGPSIISLPPPGDSLPPPGGLARVRALSLPFLVCWGGWGFFCCL